MLDEIILEVHQGVKDSSWGWLSRPLRCLREQEGEKLTVHKRTGIFSTPTELKIFKIEKIFGVLAPQLTLNVHLKCIAVLGVPGWLSRLNV